MLRAARSTQSLGRVRVRAAGALPPCPATRRRCACAAARARAQVNAEEGRTVIQELQVSPFGIIEMIYPNTSDTRTRLGLNIFQEVRAARAGRSQPVCTRRGARRAAARRAHVFTRLRCARCMGQAASRAAPCTRAAAAQGVTGGADRAYTALRRAPRRRRRRACVAAAAAAAPAAIAHTRARARPQAALRGGALNTIRQRELVISGPVKLVVGNFATIARIPGGAAAGRCRPGFAWRCMQLQCCAVLGWAGLGCAGLRWSA
jgi:hypothetical protein